jgi:hypothetical protein
LCQKEQEEFKLRERLPEAAFSFLKYEKVFDFYILFGSAHPVGILSAE